MAISKSTVLALKIALSISLLGLLLWKIDVREAYHTLLQVKPGYMAVAVGLVVGDRVLASLRTFKLLIATGAELRFRDMLRLTWMCDFVVFFLPGSLAGDAMRVYGLSKGYSTLAPAFSVIALERLFGILSLLCLAAAGGFFGYVTGILNAIQFVSILLFFGGGTLALAAGVFAAPHILKIRVFERHLLFLKLELLLKEALEFRKKKTVLAGTFLISMAMQLLRTIIVIAIALGIGIKVDVIYFLILVPVGTFATMLPISVGGWGVQEGAYVLLLQTIGVPGSRAFILSILSTLAGISVALPGLFIYTKDGLAKKKAGLRIPPHPNL